MITLNDIRNEILYEEEQQPPTLKVGSDPLPEPESENIHDKAMKLLRAQGFIPVIEPHPAIRKLLRMYRKYNPTIYTAFQPSHCTYCKSNRIRTACVFFDRIEKKFCLAYNSKFINEQIDGFKDLIASGKASGWDDSKMDEDDIPFDSLGKLNFLIAHEMTHILNGDLERYGKMKNVPSGFSTQELNKVHNIATDAVNNQELLSTNFKLGGPVGYKFIQGGMLSQRNEELFKKYNINGDKAVIISEMSKKDPWNMEENSDTYFKWMLKNIDEFDEYMKEKGSDNDDEDGENGGDGGGEGGEDDSEVIYRKGDVIFIPELNKYGEVTSVEGDNVGFDIITEEEAKSRVKNSSPRMGFKMSSGNLEDNNTFEAKVCMALGINRSVARYRQGTVKAIYMTPGVLSILTSKGVI